ncbi:MAG TPA: hypothetical protein VMZ74_08780 [Ramlibacter sp.]|nr:hypothetical protein [Ramlibacter sp.]
MSASILIGTPCYGGVVHANYLKSMLALVPALAARGISCELKTLSQESLISRARNTIAAQFLGGDYTHLLFIDADIGFAPDVVMRLLDSRKPLACAAYPLKGYDWEKLFAARETATNAVMLKRAAMRFATNVHDEDWPDDGKPATVVNGFIRVSKAATGMMLIERSVFDRLREKFPELRYRNDIQGYRNDHTQGNFWDFFDTLVHPQSRRYMSEDYTFCHRWVTGCGGEVWLDVQSTLSHAGQVAYEASFMDQAVKAP